MTDTPAQAPTNPGAIDLEPYRQRAREEWSKDGPEPLDDICGLIAAVEALRKRVDDLMEQNTIVRRRTGKAAKAMADANESAEAAEASRADLAEATKKLLDILALGTVEAAAQYGPDFDLRAAVINAAELTRTILAATPEKVIERATVERQIIEIARSIKVTSIPRWAELQVKLGCLDALKEKPKP